jgi:predicted kinase
MDNTEPDRVILMCGPAGAGKSTYARRLESHDYRRLSFDEIAWALGHRSHPVDPAAADAVHRLIQERIVETLAAGGRVVVDTSFWSRASRDRYRAFLAPLGVIPVVYYLATPRETILTRLSDRSGSHGDDVVVPHGLAITYLDGFEVPTAAEGPIRVIDA